jgi:signal transduction histidine kinase/CheY-like chemotaxis protein
VDQVERYKARYQREKAARKEAERLLEEKSMQLFAKNEDLKALANSLEQKVQERTADLEVARDEAIRSAKVKSAFLANMSHELRTPMNGVLGMLHLLDETPLNSRQLKLVRTASKSGKLLLNLINDILDITKLEANKLELEKVAFDPIELMELTIEPFFAQAVDKGIELISQIPPSIPQELLGDPTRIQQIVTNLVSNALKFTESGDVLVQCFYEGKSLSIIVSDSGVGMTEEQQKKIFSAFAQADESTTRKFGGTGLGLNICRHLVALMQGEIKVESTVGKGSSFTVDIPLEIQSKSRVLSASEDFKPITVVVADPHDVNQLIIEECLIYWQVGKVFVASDLEEIEALFHQTETTVDLLVVDEKLFSDEISLGTFTGKYPSLNVIMFTAVENLKRQTERVTRLTKPIRQSDLYNSVAPLCGLNVRRISRHNALASTRFKEQKILLVEDNVTNQEVAKEILRIANLNVTVAENGQQAIDYLERDTFDVVLMDIQMPVMDGLTATRTLRAKGGKYAEIPIIAMTAHGLKGDREKSLEAGMNDHVTKPIEPPLLFAALAEFIEVEVQQSPEPAQPTVSESLDITELPGIDMEQAMERVVGNGPFLKKILLSFKQQNDNFLDEVSKSLSISGWDVAIRHAHTLKGSAGNLAALALADRAGELEDKLKQAKLANQQPNLTSFEPELTRLQAELESVLNGIAGLAEQVEQPRAQFDSGRVIQLLNTIQEQLYADLSLVADAIDQLEGMLSSSEFNDQYQSLAAAYEDFEYDKILATSQAIAESISRE